MGADYVRFYGNTQARASSKEQNEDSANINTNQSDKSNKQSMKAHKLVCTTDSFIESNPSAWSRMLILGKEAAEEKKYTTMRYIIDQVRTKSFVDIYGKPTKICNSIEPVLARYLISAYPALSGYMETRHSIVDDLPYPIKPRKEFLECLYLSE